jgi:hypothetical protein
MNMQYVAYSVAFERSLRRVSIADVGIAEALAQLVSDGLSLCSCRWHYFTGVRPRVRNYADTRSSIDDRCGMTID